MQSAKGIEISPVLWAMLLQFAGKMIEMVDDAVRLPPYFFFLGKIVAIVTAEMMMIIIQLNVQKL